MPIPVAVSFAKGIVISISNEEDVKEANVITCS
jgi:hypothetical protein